VLVPTTAVTPIGGQSFVFVAEDKTDDKGKAQTVAHQLPVTLGNIQGQSYQVLKGLKPGDRVIVSGVARLRDGAPVAPQAGGTPAPSPAKAAG
jgi:multidrug efflux pump subunit AcrA (membrane-fusion protein)